MDRSVIDSAIESLARVSEKHNETLAGCFVLQVDELVDISQPNETRFVRPSTRVRAQSVCL